MENNNCIIRFHNNKIVSTNINLHDTKIVKAVSHIIMDDFYTIAPVSNTIQEPIIHFGLTDYADINNDDITAANHRLIDILNLTAPSTNFMNQLNIIIDDIQYCVYCVNIKKCKESYPTRSIEFIPDNSKKIVVCVVGNHDNIMKHIMSMKIDSKKYIGMALIKF